MNKIVKLWIEKWSIENTLKKFRFKAKNNYFI